MEDPSTLLASTGSKAIFNPGQLLSKKFEVEKLIGFGRFAQVYKVRDKKSGTMRAMKVHTRTDYCFKSQANTELMFLKMLSKEDSEHRIVKYVAEFTTLDRVCIVMSLESTALGDFLLQRYPNVMNTSQLKPLASSLCSGLQFLREKELLHLDLKPNNILLKSDLQQCVIADFGTASFIEESQEKLYEDVQNWYFRSPEVTLGYPSGLPIDVWNAGWVLMAAVMGNGFVTLPNVTTLVALLGMPPPQVLERAKKTSEKFEQGEDGQYRQIVRMNFPNYRSFQATPSLQSGMESLAKIRIEKNEVAPEELDKMKSLCDLLHRMLDWDPKNRITPKEALQHQYFSVSENEREKRSTELVLSVADLSLF